MLLRADPPLHLTYCTNIHPAEGWPANAETLRRIAPGLKARLSPDRPFGIGLRLGAREARELRHGRALADFAEFLAAEGMYVGILNGFPYGPFHGEPVKTHVYAPDWRTRERVDYTRDLAAILSTLLPADVDGGISTVPLSYKRWMSEASDEDWRSIVTHVVDVAEHLARLHQETGRRIHLDIEPEPDCVLETTAETIDFFEGRLLTTGAADLARRLGVGPDRAREILCEHIQVCFDCCHCAVEFEPPIEALSTLRGAGIRIGRVQLSSALTVALPADPERRRAVDARLARFADTTYLHQVVDRCGGALTRFPDLDDALGGAAAGSGCDRRIHFHVPLFASEYDGLGSSQDVVRDVINHAKRDPFTHHLEIETYTWSVLPEGLKMEIGASIAREYQWVLAEWTGTLGPTAPAP